MDKKSKYGRKELPEQKKRSIVLTMRVNSQELKTLKDRFSEDNLSGHLRNFLLNSNDSVPQNDDEKRDFDQSTLFQLKKIGVNLNQLTMKVNLGEYPIDGESEALLYKLQEFLTSKLS